MGIAIAGANGFVGQMLVPELRSRGADVKLLGRSPEALRGAGALLNLAVGNSDAGEA